MKKHLFGLIALGIGVFSSLDAAAGEESEPKLTKEQCIAASESGQDARMSRRLSEAEARFRSCSAMSCPGPIREDCLRRLEEVRRATPTVVLVIKDTDGRLVSGATISLDGAPVGNRQEGAVIRMDPGEHTLQIAATGYIPATKKVVVAEGASGREESIVLSTVAPGGTDRPHSAEATSPAAPSSTQRTISYFVMGAGALGLGFGGVSGLLARGSHNKALDDCKGNPCLAGHGDETTASHWATTSTISIGIGAALVVGGLALFFTAPKSSSTVTTAWR
jgi:hypothetical protein